MAATLTVVAVAPAVVAASAWIPPPPRTPSLSLQVTQQRQAIHVLMKPSFKRRRRRRRHQYCLQQDLTVLCLSNSQHNKNLRHNPHQQEKEPDIRQQELFRQELRRWKHDTSATSDYVSKNLHRDKKDPLMGYTISELEVLAQGRQRIISAASQTTRSNKNNSDHHELEDDPQQRRQLQQRQQQQEEHEKGNAEDDHDDDDEDGPLLDPASYVASSRDLILDEDGSILSASSSGSLSNLLSVADEDGQIDDELYRELMQEYIQVATNSTSSSCMEGEDDDDDSSVAAVEPTPLEEQWWHEIANAAATARMDPQQAEELHDRVFEEERGHLENSKIFLESLTDASKVQQAKAERRGKRYRQAQDEVIRNLYSQLDQFFNNQQQQRQQQQRDTSDSSSTGYSPPERRRETTGATFSKRRTRKRPERLTRSPSRPSIMHNTERGDDSAISHDQNDNNDSNSSSEDDDDVKPQQQPNVQKKSPWVKMIDPDTGEVFYWNEDTGEMRWELQERE